METAESTISTANGKRSIRAIVPSFGMMDPDDMQAPPTRLARIKIAPAEPSTIAGENMTPSLLLGFLALKCKVSQEKSRCEGARTTNARVDPLLRSGVNPT
jgi:hypothetical protein